MQNVKQKAATYFAEIGVTLDFVGWADTSTTDGRLPGTIVGLPAEMQPLMSTAAVPAAGQQCLFPLACLFSTVTAVR